jgi:S-(hydroxymethyl)glutathione dehydrogenase/alcohol dehydrogenase
VNNDAQVKVGQAVVVYGAGGVGLAIVQAAAMVSAYPIVAVDVVDSKLELARRMGATHTVRAGDGAPTAIRAATGAAGADVIIETTGLPHVIEEAYGLTHADGKTILVGVPRAGQNVSIYTLPLHFKKVLKGSHGGDSEPHIDIPRYVRLMKAGRLNLNDLVTHEFPLAEINTALRLFRSGETGRVLLNLG